MKNLILLAPPSAGKGTLANILSKNNNYVMLSTGDILREKAKTDDKLNEMMKSGKLLSDEIVFNALEEYLQTLDKPYILDGFPRTIKQAIMYEELLQKLNKDLGVVIYLDIPYEELLKRVVTRKVCPKCKRSYSTISTNLMPKIENTCDDCNTSLITRDDDKEEVFKVRYQEYLDKTSKLIDYYKDKDLLYKIDEQDLSKIYEQVLQIVE